MSGNNIKVSPLLRVSNLTVRSCAGTSPDLIEKPKPRLTAMIKGFDR